MQHHSLKEVNGSEIKHLKFFYSDSSCEVAHMNLKYMKYSLERVNSSYIIPEYEVLFSDKLAERYKPIIYSHECSSGPPEAVYYRIVANKETSRLVYSIFLFLEIPTLSYGFP